MRGNPGAHAALSSNAHQDDTRYTHAHHAHGRTHKMRFMTQRRVSDTHETHRFRKRTPRAELLDQQNCVAIAQHADKLLLHKGANQTRTNRILGTTGSRFKIRQILQRLERPLPLRESPCAKRYIQLEAGAMAALERNPPREVALQNELCHKGVFLRQGQGKRSKVGIRFLRSPGARASLFAASHTSS